MALSNEDQQRIIREFTDLSNYVTQLREKIFSVEADIRDHDRVLKSLENVENDRTAYRLVGDVLVKQTVGDVKPYLNETIDGLRKMVTAMEEQLKTKQVELNELQAKHNIRFVRS